MCGSTIPSREDLPGNNESGDIRAKVLEKVRKAVKKHQNFGSPGLSGKLFESEA